MSFSDEELERRRKCVSSTDIAAIMGISPYTSALDVYAQKMALVPPIPDNEAMWWGRNLEEVIAQKYQERHPETIVLNPSPITKDGWMSCSPDRIVRTEHSDPWLLEIKTAGSRMGKHWGEEGTAEIPDHYYQQVNWQMGVTGYARCDVAVLIGGQVYREYTVQFDPALFAQQRERAKAFMALVAAEEPPEPTGAEGEGKAIEAIHPVDESEILLSADEELDDYALELRLLRSEAAHCDLRVTKVANLIKARIGPHAGVEGPWGKITWKKTKDGQKIDWKAVANRIRGHWGMCQEDWDTLVGEETVVKKGYRRFLPDFEEVEDG